MNMQPNMQPRPRVSSFNMQPPLSSFLQSSPTAALKNKMNQAAMKARQFVSGAANAFSNPNASSNPAKPNRFASSGSGSGSGVVSDGEYKMFTRAELNDLYGNKRGNRGFSLMNTNFFNLGNGPIEHIIMMFQLYIALIAALSRLSMNAASMGASFLFGNETLINLFSIFLENALNVILDKNVGDMTLDQLQESLEANKPKLKKMSALLINAMTPLALGLSDICSKIATDWVTNVLPGLLKNSAIGLGNAAQAGIDVVTMGAFGEILNIISISIHTVGGMLNIIAGLQRNAGNFSQAFNTVLSAQKKLMDLKDLFSKSPSEIAAAATAAAIPEAAQKLANTAVDRLTSIGNTSLTSASESDVAGNGDAKSSVFTPGLTGAATPFSDASSLSQLTTEERLRNLEQRLEKVAAPTVNPNPIPNLNLGNLGKGIANAGIQGVRNGVRTIGSNLMRAATTFSDFLKTPDGKTVKDAQGQPIETSWWKSKWKSLFDNAINGIKNTGKYGKVNATVVQYVLRNPDVLIPFLPFPYNIAAVAARLVQTYLRYVHQQNPSTPVRVGGGGNRNNINKSMKYKQKHLKKYMSNLRRKTAKKELQLLNGIRDLKSISSV
jgi:hypothetical protein